PVSQGAFDDRVWDVLDNVIGFNSLHRIRGAGESGSIGYIISGGTDVPIDVNEVLDPLFAAAEVQLERLARKAQCVTVFDLPQYCDCPAVCKPNCAYHDITRHGGDCS